VIRKQEAKTTADPCGMTPEGNAKGKDKSEMRGSLHCAAHDEAVSSFGRDDAVFDRRKGNGKTTADHSGTTGRQRLKQE
jgi:hypothetical protein